VTNAEAKRAAKEALKAKQAAFHQELRERNATPKLTDEQAAKVKALMTAPTHEQIVESRLTAIAWFTGIVALGVVVSTIGTLVLVGQLG
jgi:hypothetical protein